MKNLFSLSSLLSFLNASPTPWHSTKFAADKLREQGFVEIHEKATWHLEKGGKYFVRRNGSSLCAFILPMHKPIGARILATHTDSPSFKLKPQPEIKWRELVLLGTEIYGSPLLNSWLNRDLGLAGRIIYSDLKGRLKEKLVRLDRYPLIIPQLAFHLDRDINEKGLLLNKQTHLSVIVGLEKNFSTSCLQMLLKEELKKGETLLEHELFLFPLEPAQLIGYQDCWIASARLDNLSSLYASLEAFLENPIPLKEELKILVSWNHEEIGSHTRIGAGSPFFSEVLKRITFSQNLNEEEHFRFAYHSMCLSIDCAHALHPSFEDKHDPMHQPILGKGIIIKYNAKQRYALDTSLSAFLYQLAQKQKIPLQRFVSRNDIPSGSTIGPINESLTSIPTLDIGCGQLSMHSSREIIAVQDYLDLSFLLSKTLEVPLPS